MAGWRRFVIFAPVAAALALIVAYGGGARPAKQGLQTPVTVGTGPLSRDDFWALVDHSATWGEDADAQLMDLRTSLSRLTPSQIAAFQSYFEEAMIRSYRWDLWGAAYVAKGGASDDGFEYFQRWLISRGRTDFERVLADPDALADLAIPDAQSDLEFEAFGYVAPEVWSAKSGQALSQMPEADVRPRPSAPSGTPFKEEKSHLAARYPKLWKRFGTWL